MLLWEVNVNIQGILFFGTDIDALMLMLELKYSFNEIYS